MKTIDKVLILGFLAFFTILTVGVLYRAGIIADYIFEYLLFTGPIFLFFSMGLFKRKPKMPLVYLSVYLQIFCYIITLLLIDRLYQDFLIRHPNFQIILIVFLFSTVLYPVFDAVNNKLYLFVKKTEINVIHKKRSSSKYDRLILVLKTASLISFLSIIMIKYTM